MSARHWLQLALTSGIGPVLIRRLVERAGSPEAALKLSAREIQEVEGIGSAKAPAIRSSMDKSASFADEQMQMAEQLSVRIICPEDGCYPELLKTISDPPVVLYMMGAMEPRDLQSLAMVGSRRCSYYGREQAERFGALLAGAGYTVISGGARGIDSAAHRGAMAHPQGRTIAVLGSGLDSLYPPENEKLFAQIASRGAVLSEYPFGTAPNPENFPRRNRIVSGMSRGVLVIEADERSGALITARLANEDHGRPVFALPGRVDNRMSTGCHKLIRDGAILVTNLEEIQEGLGPLPQSVVDADLFTPMELGVESAGAPAPAPPPPVAATLSERQALVLRELADNALAVDQLIERTGLDASVILQELTFLNLKGLVRRVDGQTYARRSR